MIIAAGYKYYFENSSAAEGTVFLKIGMVHAFLDLEKISKRHFLSGLSLVYIFSVFMIKIKKISLRGNLFSSNRPHCVHLNIIKEIENFMLISKL
jgi:hypothetical protein